VKINVAFFIVAILSACSHITYQAHADGSTQAEGWEIGTTTALSGLHFETQADGARRLDVESANTDRVEGLKQINQGLQMIVEGAAKGL